MAHGMAGTGIARVCGGIEVSEGVRFQIMGKGCGKQQRIWLPGLSLGGSNRKFQKLFDFKVFSPIRKVRAISQKLYSYSQPPNPLSV